MFDNQPYAASIYSVLLSLATERKKVKKISVHNACQVPSMTGKPQQIPIPKIGTKQYAHTDSHSNSKLRKLSKMPL